MSIIKINKNKGERFEFKSHINDFLISREITKSSETFLVIIRPRKSTHMHIHSDVEQTFYVIKGNGEILTKKNQKSKPKRTCFIKHGDLIFIPLKSWHQIKPIGDKTLEYICFNSFPNGFLPGEKTALLHAKNVREKQMRK